MSNLIIKASEIANLTDARYFSAREVDWLGFSLDSNSENYIPPHQILAIREWISGPRIVVELGALSGKDLIAQAVELLKPDAIQIGLFCEIEMLSAAASVAIIRELIPDDLEQLEDYLFEWRAWQPHLSYFMLNLEKNGFSWQQLKNNKNILNSLKQLCNEYDVMLSLVFDPSELNEIIAELKPFGLSFKGGAEEKVGIKSFDELDEIFDRFDEMRSE
jgi:phosphoribosylanthranilate isomerase